MSVRILLLTLFMAVSVPMQAEEILVISEEWPRATEKDGRGLYWEIMRAVYQSPDTVLKLQTTSYARSIMKVQKKQSDIMLGAALDEVDGVLYPNTPLDLDHVYVLYRQGENWQGQASLVGKKVGWIKDYAYDNNLSVKVDYSEFLSLTVGIKRLLRGELDFIIDAKQDLLDGLNEARVDPAHLTMSTVLDIKIYPAFADTAKGRELLAQYDQQMMKMLADGSLRKLFDRYSWPTYPH